MIDNPRVIFTAERGERILSAISYRGRCIIATDERILEWRPDDEQFIVLDYLIMPSENVAWHVQAKMQAAADRYP